MGTIWGFLFLPQLPTVSILETPKIMYSKKENKIKNIYCMQKGCFIFHTSNNLGRKWQSSMTSTPYMALDIGLCISGCTTAADSNTDLIICLTLEWISNHLTAKYQKMNLWLIQDINISFMDTIIYSKQNFRKVKNALSTLMLLLKLLHKIWSIQVVQPTYVILKNKRKKEEVMMYLNELPLNQNFHLYIYFQGKKCKSC